MSSDARDFASYPAGHVEGYPDTFKQCFRAFYDYISGRTKEKRYPTFSEGHKEMLIVDAIIASHEARHWLPVDFTENTR
jgi:predicted dehydrogenase